MYHESKLLSSVVALLLGVLISASLLVGEASANHDTAMPPGTEPYTQVRLTVRDVVVDYSAPNTPSYEWVYTKQCVLIPPLVHHPWAPERYIELKIDCTRLFRDGFES